MVHPDRGPSRERRYLLGDAKEDECSAMEREYFGDEAAVDRIAAAEEDLIEDYLGDRLMPDERRRFDRHYLASPLHRRRVETIRRLTAVTLSSADRASVIETQSRHRSYQWLALAAAVVVTVGSVWLFMPRRHEPPRLSTNPPASPRGPEPRSNQPLREPSGAPHVFAVSLSPGSVRSADDTPSLVIPAGTDLVALQLEGDGGRAMPANARVVIQTVAGDEVWRGPAVTAINMPPGAIARVDVPAALLGVNDYFVVLFGTDPSGREEERYRCFLRVRSR